MLCSWVNFWSDYHDWNGSWLPDTLVAGFVYLWPVFVCESVGKYSWWCYGVWCSCWRMFWSVLFATNCYNLCALGLLSLSWSSLLWILFYATRRLNGTVVLLVKGFSKCAYVWRQVIWKLMVILHSEIYLIWSLVVSNWFLTWVSSIICSVYRSKLGSQL